MKIQEMPVHERPREKLVQYGAESLNDAELLAIFLRNGTKGRSAIDLSHDLIRSFGSLRKLILADEDTLCQAKGIGRAKYAQLQAAIEMAKRHIHEEMTFGEQLSSPLQVVNLLRYKLRDCHSEVFAAVYLNTQNQIIDFAILFHGSINQTDIHPREIVRKCLHHNAAGIIFSHNHPSGDVTPSQADIAITKKLVSLLKAVDVKVLDHIIIGNSRHFSFATEELTKSLFHYQN